MDCRRRRKNSSFNLAFSLFFFLTPHFSEACEVSLNTGARSYPVGGNIEISSRADSILWDQRSEKYF
jgi:hypothetical protein